MRKVAPKISSPDEENGQRDRQEIVQVATAVAETAFSASLSFNG